MTLRPVMDAICLDWSDGQLVAVPGFAPEGYGPMLVRLVSESTISCESPNSASRLRDNTVIGTVFVILPAVSFRLVDPGLIPVIDSAPILGPPFMVKAPISGP